MAKDENTKRETGSSLRVDVGARAEAKLEIKATVPEGSTGRLVDALTDLFRPFSESRSLQADRIRLQREEIAIEIAKRARDRLLLEGASIGPVPNKVLVPLLESASNEDADDDYMLDRWSDLLASASSKRNVEPRFVGILRELHGRQAKLFERIAENSNTEFARPLAQISDAPAMLEPVYLRQTLDDLFRGKKTAPDTATIYATVVDWINRPGCALIDIIVHFQNDMWSVDGEELAFSDTVDGFDLEVLASLGLCRRVNDYFRSKSGYEIQTIYYYLTELGVRFYFACTNQQPEDETPEATES